MMAPGRSFLSAALAIVLASEHLQSTVNAQQTFVCGNTYQDASQNCTVNPACPSGSGAQDCEPEGFKQCYVMPADTCFSPPTRAPVTDSPTLSPIPAPLKVCAGSYEEAVENCLTNDSCDENSCSLGQACFDVAVDLCGTLAPTSGPTPASYKVCGANSFESEANCLDESKRCPTGAAAECGPTEACFNVPADVCGVTQGPSTSPVASNPEPTSSPTSAPTIVVAPTVPTMPPTPQFIAVCGTDPNDAQLNICTNPRCPTGDNCAVGGCYAFAYQECPDIVPTTDAPSTPPTPPLPPTPTASPSPEPSVLPVTPSPTGSPVYNKFFCGTTYQMAETNCWTADTCSTVKACTKPGEQCFGIQSERCNSPAPTDEPTTSPVSGPQPTDSPTTSSAPTMKPVTGTPTIQPSPAPSKSPVVNTNFCGATYDQAEQNCSNLTACPSGTCPSGMTCYVGIQCASETPGESTTMATTTVPDTTTTATITTPTVDSGDQNPTTTDSPDALLYEKYCGTSLQNAMAFCSFATPCNTTDDCSSSQSCFSIPVPCGSEGGLNPPGPTPVNPPTPTLTWTPPTPPPSATTPGPTAKPVGFDPNNTLFCGKNYTDALTNCFMNTPCPSGDPATCPSGQSCFPGIANCETPPPTTASPTLPPGTQLASPSSSPSKRPITAAPTLAWDWEPAPSSAPKSKILGLVANSIFVGGAILGVLLL